MLRLLGYVALLVLILMAGSAYVVLECRCDLPSVAHAPFLPPSDPKAQLLKQAKTPDEWAALTRQDLMEARRDRVFVVPGIAILYAMLNEAEPWGITRAQATEMGYQIEWEAAIETLSKMHKRGIRVLPGGDYGFAFNPHLQNARDLEFFVKYLGMTPLEAIRSTTVYGGQIMMRAHELGAVKEGFLADLLLVDGDPLANLSILRDPKRLLAVMKDGVFAKAPEIASARRWERAA